MNKRLSRKGMGCLVLAGLGLGIDLAIAIATRDLTTAAAVGLMLLMVISWYPIFRATATARKRRPSQVRLNREGYGFRSGFGVVRYLRWLPEMEIDLTYERRGYYHLRMARLTPTGVVDWSTLIHLWFRASRKRADYLREYMRECREAALRGHRGD